MRNEIGIIKRFRINRFKNDLLYRLNNGLVEPRGAMLELLAKYDEEMGQYETLSNSAYMEFMAMSTYRQAIYLYQLLEGGVGNYDY